MSPRPTTRRFGLARLILAGALCLPAWAQAAPPPNALNDLVPALESDDWAVRESATAGIGDRDDVTLKAIEAQLARDDLSPEQRARLLIAAREQFVNGPRAALGVQFANQGMMPADDRVVIQQVFAQFPANGLIMRDDEITAVNGVRVRSTGDWSGTTLRPHIIACDPGDTLRLTIIRQGERREIDVPVGRYADLVQAQPIGAADLQAAWAVRSAKYRVNEPSLVIPTPEIPSADAAPAPWAARTESRALVAGGRGRAPSERLAIGEGQQVQVWFGPQGVVENRPAIRPGGPVAEVLKLQQRLSELRRQERELAVRLAAIDDLPRNNVAEEMARRNLRNMIRDQMVRLDGQVREVLRQINELQGRRAR